MTGALLVIESDLLIDWVEDWSKVRSPARAKRRRARGFPQNITMVPVINTTVYRIGDNLIMHPSIADAVRRELLITPRYGSLESYVGSSVPFSARGAS